MTIVKFHGRKEFHPLDVFHGQRCKEIVNGKKINKYIYIYNVSVLLVCYPPSKISQFSAFLAKIAVAFRPRVLLVALQ